MPFSLRFKKHILFCCYFIQPQLETELSMSVFVRKQNLKGHLMVTEQNPIHTGSSEKENLLAHLPTISSG